MRLLAVVAMTAAVVGFGAPARAGMTTESKIVTYPIAGRTGAELLLQMDKKGPKHGFLTRAIAQTRYTVKWTFIWESDTKKCRLKSADADLAIIYNYPRVTTRLNGRLVGNWRAFMRGVVGHEETHGALARRMVQVAQRSVLGVSVPHDASCRATRAEMKRRISATYAKYEAQQRAFDTKEHGDNGHVVKLVEALVR